MCPLLEYCVKSWVPYYYKDMGCIEKVQRLARKMLAGQRGKWYGQLLHDLGLSLIEHSRSTGDLIPTLKIVQSLTDTNASHLFGFDYIGGNWGK